MQAVRVKLLRLLLSPSFRCLCALATTPSILSWNSFSEARSNFSKRQPSCISVSNVFSACVVLSQRYRSLCIQLLRRINQRGCTFGTQTFIGVNCGHFLCTRCSPFLLLASRCKCQLWYKGCPTVGTCGHAS